MYKIITIGKKDYKLEYSIEASLYGDCVSKLTGMLADIEIGGENNDVKSVLSGMSSLPQTTLTIFYAGLMENHGDHPNGDGSVPDIYSAKQLMAQYLREHAEDDEGNFYSLMNLCINQMAEDGFFKLVGLDKIMQSPSPKKRVAKTPQDHLKKATEK